MDELPPIDPMLADLYAEDADIPPLDPSVMGRIQTAVQTATGFGGAAADADSLGQASGSTAAKVLTVKGAVALAALMFAGGMLSGVASTLVLSPAPAPTPEPAPAVTDEQPERAPDPPPRVVVPRTLETHPAHLEDHPRTERERVPEPTPGRGLADPPTPATPRSRGNSLREERRLLEATRAALARGHHDHARVLLARHGARYPDGEHTQERESLAVETALASRRWAEVELLGRRFLRAYPSSLYRGRVTRLMRDARERSHAPDDAPDRNPSDDTRDHAPPPSD